MQQVKREVDKLCIHICIVKDINRFVIEILNYFIFDFIFKDNLQQRHTDVCSTLIDNKVDILGNLTQGDLLSEINICPSHYPA